MQHETTNCHRHDCVSVREIVMNDVPIVLETNLQRRAAFVLSIDVDPTLDTTRFVVEPPAIPWKTEDGEIHAICEMHGGFPRILLPRIGIVRVVDESGQVHGTVTSADKSPLLMEVYYRFALPMILQAAGAEMLHASAVRIKSGVVGFCGVSGTGKSTLAFTMSRRNHPHWADDSLVFVPRDQTFQALRLPFRPRVEIAADSDVAFVSGTEAAPLAAMVILQRLAGGFVAEDAFRVEINRFSSADAFRALMPHIFSFLLSDSKRNALMMARYFDLAARLPIFDVRFTPCLDALPKLCAAIEDACFAAL